MSNSSSNERKNFINGLQVSDDVAKNLLKKPLYHTNDAENLELYYDYVAHQKEAFKAIMYYFNDMLTELKKEDKISGFIEFRARIKSLQSALCNDGLNNKVLDDVFAMEFIGTTEKEVDFLLSVINKKTITIKIENLNKPNGYIAKHRLFSINEETQKEIAEKFGIKDSTFFPMLECQFKTLSVAKEATIGTAAHFIYKKVNPKVIQKKYDKDEFKLGYNIPQMWVSKDATMVKLSSDETLKKLYPFLNISKKKENNKDLSL